MIENNINHLLGISKSKPSKNPENMIARGITGRDSFEVKFRELLERKQQRLDKKLNTKTNESTNNQSKITAFSKETKVVDELETYKDEATKNELTEIEKLESKFTLLENIIQKLEDNNLNEEELKLMLSSLLELINNHNLQIKPANIDEAIIQIKDLINGTHSMNHNNLDTLIPILKSLSKELENSSEVLENTKQVQPLSKEDHKAYLNSKQISGVDSASSAGEEIQKNNVTTNSEFQTSQDNEESQANNESRTDTNRNNTFSLLVKEKEVEVVGSKEIFNDNQTEVVADVKTVQFEDLRIKNIPDSNKNLFQGNLKLNENIFSQIYESAKITLNDETSEMVMKLKPDNLGNVSLKLVIERGMVIAKFDVENQIVKQALESNLEDLRTALGDKGFEIKEFNVSVNKESKQFHNFFRKSKKNKESNIVKGLDEISQNAYMNSHLTLDNTSKSINFLA